MSTHNLYLEQKFENNVYPCKPQFNYIKEGCKGVFITRTCFRDVCIVKLGFAWVYIILLTIAQNMDCGYSSKRF